jgi:hypothetical protein
MRAGACSKADHTRRKRSSQRPKLCRIVSELTPVALAKAPERRVFERLLSTIRSITPESIPESGCFVRSHSEGILKCLFSDSLGVGTLVKIGIPWSQLMDLLRAITGAILAPFMIHELLLSPTETASGSHPCCVVSFTAVTRVQIPSGTPNLINDLERKSRFVVGTKGNSRTAKSHHPAVPELHFPRFDGFFVGTKRHNLTPQLRAPLRERETSELRHFELRVFVP